MLANLPPGVPAPQTGYYEERDARERPTGYVIHTRKGEALPYAPPGFTWQLRENDRKPASPD